MRRQGERRAARDARRRKRTSPETPATGAGGGEGTVSDGGDKDATAAVAAAALAAAAAAGENGAGEQTPPPLTMDQIPPQQRPALLQLLGDADASSKAAAGDVSTGAGRLSAGAGAGADRKRAKKFDALEHELTELLIFPGPMALMAGDQFCGTHFMVQGPKLARQLTAYAETHEATYEALVWMAKQGSLLIIVTAVVGFLLPPAIHHGLPAPASMRRHYGMDVHPSPAEAASTRGPAAAAA